MIDGVYPTVKCEHPVTVKNPYTGEFIQVPCGCCKSCALQRSRKMSLLCQFEEKDYKYAWFVTLTYDQQNIPYLVPFYNDDEKEFEFYFHNPRNKERDDTILNGDYKHHFKPKDVIWLVERCKLYSRGIGVLDKTDAQKFLKRIRYYIHKDFKYETIRYYCVGEYGPKTLRPHYHFILFTDSEKVSSNIEIYIHKSWKLGRVDSSLSRHGISSYVAGYVNSTVSLPSLYSFCEAKPFSLHSQFFATRFFESQREEIYKSTPYNFVYACRELFGSYVEFHPWRSLTSMFFPKCKGFGVKSRQELYRSYTIICEAWRYYGQWSPSKLAQMILEDNIMSPLSDYFDFDAMYARARRCPAYCESGLDKSVLEDIVHSYIYSELNLSYHFISFCCYDGFDFSHRIVAFERILNFYNWKDYDNLTNFYRLQELLSTDVDFGVRRIPFMYHNFSLSRASYYDGWLHDTFDCFDNNDISGSDDIQHSRYYTELHYKSCKEFRDANKLKYLNDFHKFFDYE